MKKFLTIIVIGAALVACLGGEASAIDVKPSTDTSKAAAAPAKPVSARSFQAVPVKSEHGLLDKLKREVTESQRTTNQKFDDYIDADGDGVDDRVAKQAKVKEQTEKVKPADTAPGQRVKSKKASKSSIPRKEKP